MNEILQEINNQLQIISNLLYEQRVGEQVDILKEEQFEAWYRHMENIYSAYSHSEE
jgi:hypothetical protein